MKSKRITSLNPNAGSVDNNYVKVREVNPVIDDLGFLYPLYHQPFTGEIDLTRMFTHYDQFTCTATLTLTIKNDPVIMGNAFVRIIGDGTNDVTFTAFKKMEGSQDWSNTLNAINLCSFAYDGTDYWYRIDREAV
jgi:hypothetical protein